jgi:hypothetical protein
LVPTPPDTYFRWLVRDEEHQAPSNGTGDVVMKKVWVNRETVLSARDERGLERRLYSLESALRRRAGSIVEVTRPAGEVHDRHVAVIRYELPLPQF